MGTSLLENLSNTFKDILKQPSIKTFFDDTITSIPELLSKNPITYYHLYKDIKEISISDYIFYSKLDRFFRGIEDIDFETRIKFLSKFVDGREIEFAKKVLLNIDLIDDETKAHLIANLQRALMYEKIDLGIFFRLINAVRQTPLEDLYFLLENKDKKTFDFNVSVDFLSNAGLLYTFPSAVVNDGVLENINIYELSSLGRCLIDHCLNYGSTPHILKSNLFFYSSEQI